MSTPATTLVTEQLGYPAREEAREACAADINPNVRRVGQLVDGSWAIEWYTGQVSGKDGGLIPKQVVRWAERPVVAVSIEVTEELRRRVAIARPCKRELADDTELRVWLLEGLAAQLATVGDV
jgi:hypothetical protein